MRLAVLMFTLTAALAPAADPVRLIFDTDMGNDVDDALALGMIHGLESKGEVKLLAVTVTKDNPYAAAYVELVNRFYKRGSIPVGVVKGGKTPEDSPMIRVPVEKHGGKPKDMQEATGLLRRILEKEKDGSVVIAQVGFSTNLARLLESEGGMELVRRKVRLLSVMAGAFPTGKPEYNVKTDVPSARKVFGDWPGPVVFSGFEIGLSILYPAAAVEKMAADHPVAEAYRNYKKMPYDRPTWDLTSALYGIRPRAGYFDLSAPGTVQVADDGATSFTESASGRQRYLKATEAQRKQALQTMIELIH